nr:MAG TPA: hypothetical protein [Caudoviricetes sp.]
MARDIGRGYIKFKFTNKKGKSRFYEISSVCRATRRNYLSSLSANAERRKERGQII